MAQPITTTTAKTTSLIIASLVAVLLAACVASLMVGSARWSLPTSFEILHRGGTDLHNSIMFGIRIPRTLLALACGAALGIAGCISHVMTRNPMADPGLLGVNAGAALGVVLMVQLLGATRVTDYMWGGIIGALIAAAAVMATSRRITAMNYMSALVICGAVITALCNAFTSALVLTTRETLNVFRFWSVGSLQNRDLSVLTALLPFLLSGLALAIIFAPRIKILLLGDDVAESLGVPVKRLRIIGIAAVTLLVAAATAACGALAFLGLLAPLSARHLVRRHPGLYPLVAALIGAIYLLVADTIGRVVLPSGELSVGIVLALVGAPVFVIMARKLTGDRA